MKCRSYLQNFPNIQEPTIDFQKYYRAKLCYRETLCCLFISSLFDWDEIQETKPKSGVVRRDKAWTGL